MVLWVSKVRKAGTVVMLAHHHLHTAFWMPAKYKGGVNMFWFVPIGILCKHTIMILCIFHVRAKRYSTRVFYFCLIPQ
jgi:hypothetical protein